MKKIKLTCAHAIVKHLIAQKILIDGKKEPLFAGAFGIFGHGNVACLGQALEENKESLPTFRGHHRNCLCKGKKKKTDFCSNKFGWTRFDKYGYCCCSCNEQQIANSIFTR